MTDLRAAARDYLALRRSLGPKLAEAERMLDSFPRPCGGSGRFDCHR